MNKLRYIIIPFFILLTLTAVIPYVLPLIDTASFTNNYRMPYSMGEDYFLYNRYSNYISSKKTIPIIGDSVIWGHYTDNDHTLSACFNNISPEIKFTNMGLDGIHPAALNGLIKIYSSEFKNKKIIAGINLLWMSSPRHDLSGPANSEINHKMLLPQFYPDIPSYKPSFEEKLSAIITRSIPAFSWINHIRLSRFAEKSFYTWTIENPHKNIMSYFSQRVDEFKASDGVNPDKMQEQNIEWITTNRSLQWKFMMDTLISLKKNENEVAVIITPFNTYMMTEQSRKKYFSILADMEWILRENGIIPILPLIPDKKYFADASHPTADGYKLIAEDIMKNREFRKFLLK